MVKSVKVQVEALEEAVAASAVNHVRLSWIGQQLFGAVIGSARAFVAEIVPLPGPPQLYFNLIPEDRRYNLIAQGKAGAVAGVLVWMRGPRTWHWVPWILLMRQHMHRWVEVLDDPDVAVVGDKGWINFEKIVGEAPKRQAAEKICGISEAAPGSAGSLRVTIVQRLAVLGRSGRWLSRQSGLGQSVVARFLRGGDCRIEAATAMVKALRPPAG